MFHTFTLLQRKLMNSLNREFPQYLILLHYIITCFTKLLFSFFAAHSLVFPIGFILFIIPYQLSILLLINPQPFYNFLILGTLLWNFLIFFLFILKSQDMLNIDRILTSIRSNMKESRSFLEWLKRIFHFLLVLQNQRVEIYPPRGCPWRWFLLITSLCLHLISLIYGW